MQMIPSSFRAALWLVESGRERTAGRGGGSGDSGSVSDSVGLRPPRGRRSAWVPPRPSPGLRDAGAAEISGRSRRPREAVRGLPSRLFPSSGRGAGFQLTARESGPRNPVWCRGSPRAPLWPRTPECWPWPRGSLRAASGTCRGCC